MAEFLVWGFSMMYAHVDALCNGSFALRLAELSFSLPLAVCGSGSIVVLFAKCLKDGSRCHGLDEGF